jgi:hypothetical protein
VLVRLAVIAVALAFLLATESIIALDTAPPGRGDVINYVPMAAAAPDLPDQDIGSAYTGRFATHYAVGLVSEALGVSVKAAYAIVWALVCAALLAVMLALLSRLGLPPWTLALCAGLFVANPYTFRQFAVETGRVQDVVLVLGVAVVLLGLLRVNPWLVLAGLALGICGRQTALLVAPVAAAWMVWGPEWRDGVMGRRAALAVAALAVVGVIYAVVLEVTEPFTVDFEPHVPDDTVLARLDELPGSATELADHALRTFIPLLPALAVLAALVSVRGIRRGWPWPAVGCVALAAVIVVQPLAIDPAFPGFESNEQRLTGLGLLPLVVAIAILARDVVPRERPSPAWWAALAGLFAVGSLHHTFTDPGPGSLAQFLVLQVLVSAGLAFLVLRSYQAAS